ncbi:MAG: EAL domain-containing protein [Gemmatimonadales bacterium]|nr:EAL domain-containing protein [Gemmatimonadales bacterium]NIN11812.1 EAL domain-containing protein [Gemmatimonadales bacterium]NIN50362.1 EAL domain-containing protein [Gemmatimonadales bacterium]NIP07826.1 EAL domain-containing protein [Gemmatimonadales bacterium]NIR01904.1 EAL domain-containing protein [Gemmatimonadales bacterium]
MTPLGVISMLTLVGAASWSAVLAWRPTDLRLRLLAGLLSVVALGHLLSIAMGLEWGAVALPGLGDLSDLGLAVVVLLTVLLLDRVISRHGGVVRAYGEERAYLEELFESSPEAIALIDRDGAVMRANDAFIKLFGYSAAELAGRSIDELLAPDEHAEEAVDLTRKVARGEKVAVEAVRRRKDGTLVDVAITGAPVRIPTGRIAIFGVYRDVTERKRVEAALGQLEKAVETTQLGVTVTDINGRIIYTNPADAAMHGFSVGELIGQDVRVFAPGGVGKPMTVEQIEAMESWRRESINARKDGSTFPVHLMSDVLRDAEGNIVSIVTTCEDISGRKEAESALRESEERYALAARGANDGLWDWNLETNEVYYSDRWKSILGYGEAEIEPNIEAWLGRVHLDDLERVRGELDAHVEGRSSHYDNEHRIRCKDGTYRWVLVRAIAVRDADGSAHRMAGWLTDVTPRKRVEEELARDALYDPLTGLPNRAFFTNLLDRSVRRSRRRKGYEFALLFLDLDRFKLINDSLGHDTGDELLVGVAERLEKCLRPGDVVARLAGDEFCILLDDIKESSDATRVAERVQEALKAPFNLKGHNVFATVSIGIALSQRGMEGPEHLLRDADTAMYRAKARGKARFEVFDKAMHARAMAVLQLENDLRHALENEHFRLMYQPVVSLDSRRIDGFEALVRWEHPERGMVAPMDFVPVAEETGLIVPLGHWVLRQACRQMADWAARYDALPDLSVSVNLSAKQLQQADLVQKVTEALREAELEPRRLKLEIAEPVLMDDPDYNMELVRELNDLGVQVQIDDFGTGYSSLAYLGRFNIDTLKIDRSFISKVGVPEDKGVIAEAIITLARDLGINVIAEGIETDEQSKSLIELKCEHGQGFLYSQPVDSETAGKLLDEQNDHRKKK